MGEGASALTHNEFAEAVINNFTNSALNARTQADEAEKDHIAYIFQGSFIMALGKYKNSIIIILLKIF